MEIRTEPNGLLSDGTPESPGETEYVRETIWCACYDTGHAMIIEYEKKAYESGWQVVDEPIVRMQTIENDGVFKRIWEAIKYVWNHRKYHMVDYELIVRKEDAIRIRDIMNMYVKSDDLAVAAELGRLVDGKLKKE